MDVKNLHKQFCHESWDEKGVISGFEIVCPDHFNFAYDVVDVIAKAEPQRRAMLWCNEEGEEHTFTFGDMKKYSDKTANMLLKHGVKKGDKVLLILKRHYEFWFTILALHKIGAIAIPATNLLTTKDIIYRLQSASISAVVCTADGDLTDYVDEAQKSCPELVTKFIVRGEKQGWLSYRDEMEAASEELARIENSKLDDMLLYFTSGTAGYPKMVVHNYAYPLAHIMTAKYWHNVDPDGLHLTVAETGWAKAVWGKLYGQWLMAAGIFVYDFEKFSPDKILEKIEQYKITTFCAPPTIYRFFIKEGMGGYDLSSLKYATVAGEALNEEIYKQFYDKTGLRLMEAYGQTETTVTVANFLGADIKVGSMGKESPMYDVKLVNANDEPVGVGEVGEIVLHTTDELQIGMFKGYYRDEELTKRAWHNNYYHTGDTAYKDEDGFFWYVGRTDDLIKSSGYRIGPFEIESVLMEHPAVLECAITGVPDPVRGQVVKATIVLTKKYAPSDELAKELQNFVKKATAPYKYPRVVEFVTELPKTISGKIRRVEIREKDKQKQL